MSKVLIINGSKKFAHSDGSLNNSLATLAESYLTELNHDVKVTEIDKTYDIETEIEKWLWSDVVIHQNPAWWMGPPWIVKKYIDEVFTVGHGRLYQSDGRTRSDAEKKYGSGGLIQGKRYMFSVTWNAPQQAFTDPSQFFEGAGVDGVYLPFHKAHQFLGMSPIKTFMSNDVMKNPQIEVDFERYKAHLKELI
ncbi:NAD(P)H-dependent oxidoreductase [Pseudovibrio axinellae]|nr:NAD(P)H-dependent oxidoreductase [Pseudovibrio axinellae]